MKIRLPFRKENREAEVQTLDAVFDLTGGMDTPDGFEVNVRNDEPIIRMTGEEKSPLLTRKGVRANIAAAAAVMALISLFLSAAETSDLIFYAVPGLLVFLLLAVFELFEKEKLRLGIAAVIMVGLIASLFIFRDYIGSGLALIINQFYDQAESAQAYLYTRPGVGSMGDEDPYRSMHIAALWLSAMLFLVAALPPASVKRTEAAGVGCLAMILFAYYGLVPSGIFIALLAVSLMIALSRGSILAMMPVLLVVMLVFGAVILADPGENYGISRADENFRDRFALRSAFIEREDSSVDNLSELEQEMQEQQDRTRQNAGSEYITEHRWLITAGIIALILAAIGAAVFMAIRRLRRRQAENRRGIDSSDPREAITAMFPYAVKWLRLAGLEPSGKPFSSLLPMIRADISEQYGDRFSDMYTLWEEAAYSDHEMTEDSRGLMKSFLSDTIEMINEDSDLRSRITNTFRYAL